MKPEKLWMNWISTLPCMVRNYQCSNILHRHHLTHGGRPKNDFRTIPLCSSHHHWNSPLPIGDAYHKGTKAWERKHGSQEEMLIKLQERWEQQFNTKPWEE